MLDVIEQEHLVDNALHVGEYLLTQLRQMAQDPTMHITDVRGRGLMIGIDLDIPHSGVRRQLVFDEHCFTGCAATNILRLLPPLCLSHEEADQFLSKLKKTLQLS